MIYYIVDKTEIDAVHFVDKIQYHICGISSAGLFLVYSDNQSCLAKVVKPLKGQRFNKSVKMLKVITSGFMI